MTISSPTPDQVESSTPTPPESSAATVRRQPGRWLLVGLLAVPVLFIYFPYIVKGNLTYDDWSVALLGRGDPGFVNSYLSYFRGAFQNRPLAPIYYAITTNVFGSLPTGYIIANVSLWLASVAIVAVVLARTVGALTAAIFFLIAALPTFSTTVIFSPGMQSIGSVSIFIWSLSFLALNRYLVHRTRIALVASWLLILASLLTYEITIPLLVLSALLPLVRPWAASNGTGLRGVLRGIVLFVLPIVIALGIVYVYQKIYLPRYMADISRLRGTTLYAAGVISNCWLDVFRKEIPALLTAAPVFHFRHSGFGTLIFGVLVPTAAACAVLWKFRSQHTRTSIPRTLLILLILAIALGGVLLIHLGANVRPSSQGYVNRGLSSMSILIALAHAMVASYLIGKHRIFVLPTACLIGLWMQAFVAQRDNYIKGGILAQEIADDAAEMVRERQLTNICLFGNVPQYVDTNFNNETVFSDEITDFALAVRIRIEPGRIKWGGSLTQQMIAIKRVHIEDDKVSVIPYLPALPVEEWWFYEYDLGERRGRIMKVRDAAHFGEIVDGIGRTGNAPFP